MLSFPNCKINLGLNVTEKRPDGYHNIETVFFPINLTDVLEFVKNDTFHFNSSGLEITGNAADNLVVKAYQMLKTDFPELPALTIHLHKAIPMGAGLGGGSSNGAFMLEMLNRQFNLGLNEEQLVTYSLKLGSDCPFFIKNYPCFATGRGEIMEPVEFSLEGFKIAILNPGIHVSTRSAFESLALSKPSKPIKEIIQQPIATWKDDLKNDFEQTVFQIHPEIGEIKQQLYHAGAIYASMTGTGSTVYGIFKKETDFDLSIFEKYFTAWV